MSERIQPQSSQNWLPSYGRLAIANIVSNLMVPLAGIVDTAFLGHLADIRHLAGVALATVIFNFIYWGFGFLRMGTTGLTAQAVGRQDRTEVWLIGLRGGLLALGFGLVLLGLQIPLRELGFALLQADADVLASGREFYNARIWGAPAVLLNYVLLGWFLGQSQGRQVITLSVIGNGANVVLDSWFIRQLGWASYGAGLATALSQYLMLAVGVGMVLGKGARVKGERRLRQPCPLGYRGKGEGRTRGYHGLTFGLLKGGRDREDRVVFEKLLDWAAIQKLFQLNRDILVRTLALLLSFALFTNLSSGMGRDILAVNTLLLQVVTLVAYFLDGIAFATETYAGRFYGQRNVGQLRRLLRLGGGVSVMLSVGIAIAFLVFPKPFFLLLTDHDEVLALVNTYVGWLLPVLSFGAVAFMLDGYFLGLTAGGALRNSTVISTFLGFGPVAMMAYWLQSPHLLWLAMTCFMAARAVTLGWLVRETLVE
ncbi:MAG: MATE family efflux transporter [Cyanobacteria bacterium P01_G01_bin.38]